MSRKLIKSISLSALGLFISWGCLFSITSNRGNAAKVTLNLEDTCEADIRSYYSSVTDKKGNDLLLSLHTLLRTNSKSIGYDYAWNAYKITDRDWDLSPASEIDVNDYSADTDNPYLHLLYRNDNGTTAAFHELNDGNKRGTVVDREHVWPKSIGGFDVNAPAGTDLHQLLPADSYNNSTGHNDNPYGVNESGTRVPIGTAAEHNNTGIRWDVGTNQNLYEPQDSDKGDIARACFYMAARYSKYESSSEPWLKLVEDYSKTTGTEVTYSSTQAGILGGLSTLIEWHKLDPVDDFEIHRNNLIYSNFQNNRNPFIDFPDWVDIAFGNGTDTTDPATDTLYTEKNQIVLSDAVKKFQKQETYSSLKYSYEIGTEYTDQWELVESDKKLYYGDVYTFASVIDGEGTAMSTESYTNNRRSTYVNVQSSSFPKNDKVLRFILGGEKDNWTFKTDNYLGASGYLSGPTSTGNHLKILSSGTAPTFTVKIEDKKAIVNPNGTYSGYSIQYNSKDKIFSCYTSTQKPVYLYRLVQKNVNTYYPTKTGDEVNVALRFGNSFLASEARELFDFGATEYGIAYVKGDDCVYTHAKLTGAYTDKLMGQTTYEESLEDAILNNHYLQYIACMDNIPTSSFDIYITAKGYIKIGSKYYYTKARGFSVNDIAKEYFNNHASDETVAEHIDMLKWLSTYVVVK